MWTQKRGTIQRWAVVQKDQLYAFENFNRHGRVHVRSQREKMQTDNMKKHVTLNHLLRNTMKIVKILVQRNISHSLNVVLR